VSAAGNAVIVQAVHRWLAEAERDPLDPGLQAAVEGMAARYRDSFFIFAGLEPRTAEARRAAGAAAELVAVMLETLTDATPGQANRIRGLSLRILLSEALDQKPPPACWPLWEEQLAEATDDA
jgi:hypothetical protein